MNALDTGSIEGILTDLLNHRTQMSQRQEVDQSVAAVMTFESDARYFSSSLTALLEGSLLPSLIVIADRTGQVASPVHAHIEIPTKGSDASAGARDIEAVDVTLVRAKGSRSFSEALSKSLQYVQLPPSVRCLWLLHDDSKPADGRCLELLMEAWRNAPTTSLLGAKQMDWADEGLHDVGYYAYAHGLQSLVVEGEPDQEQYDTRSDVFAVSMQGALLPVETLTRFQGLDSWFGDFAEGADFCRRICLGGGRVVVVPQARIAHRRARYEGVRSGDGNPIDEENPINTTMGRMLARQRYYYTDQSIALWPLLWLLSLLSAVVNAVRYLVAKQPYDSLCVLCLPWKALSSVVPAVKSRHRITVQATVPLGKLTVLQASHRQMKQWRDRVRAFDSQRHTILLSPLALTHLRVRVLKRWSLALAMALIAAGLIVFTNWHLFLAAFSGGSLYSPELPATGADFWQLTQSASTSWVFGAGMGLSAPPAPWLLFWLLASVVTLGHPVVALSLTFFLAAPLSALSFWALAGTFTRSDWVRASCGILWSSLSLVMGLYGSANLPMLTVMVFLPGAFAFVFRGVGRYRTEDPIKAHPSVQASACAALCFVPVICSEPQLLLPLIVCFLVFLALVPAHRIMLLLVPIPSAFAIAPTLIDSITHLSGRTWRQLFADVLIPSTTTNGTPQALDLNGIMLRAFGLDADKSMSSWSGSSILANMAVLFLFLLIALAVVTLLVPFALRITYIMWVVALSGLVDSILAASLVISVDIQGQIAGSVLPGVALTMLALISCVCLLTGAAITPYEPVKTVKSKDHVPSRAGLMARPLSLAVAAGRASLVVMLLLGSAVWYGYGLSRSPDRVGLSRSGLPQVAVDYLKQDSSRRILAVSTTGGDMVSFTVVRTQRGDLVDSSPALRADMAFSSPETSVSRLGAPVARLLSHTDSQAIERLAKLGFGGIYVIAHSSADSHNDAYQNLLSNINGSDGVQEVVSGNTGTYYRLSTVGIHRTGVDRSGQQAATSSPWRYAWLWATGLIGFLYCLVALPRFGSRRQEKA